MSVSTGDFPDLPYFHEYISGDRMERGFAFANAISYSTTIKKSKATTVKLFSRFEQIQWTLRRRYTSRAKHSLEQEGRKPFCQAACKSDMTKQGSYNRQPKRPEESFMQFTYKTNTQVSLYSKAYSYSTGGKRRIYFYKKEVFFSFNDSMKSVLLAAALLNRGSFA